MSHDDAMNVMFLLIGIILGLVAGSFLRDMADLLRLIVDAARSARTPHENHRETASHERR